MKPNAFLLAAMLSATFHAQSSVAEIIYQTGFEAPAFTPGLPIRGQDNWEMFHDGEAISVSTNNARTGAQCLRFDGAWLEQNGPNSATAYCFSRALETLSNNPPPIVEITASVRLDGPQTGTNGTPDQDILSANLMAVVPQPNGTGELLGGFFVSSAGRIFTYSRVPEDNYKYSVPYTFGTYRTLTLRADFIARRLTWSVDGVELGSGPFPSTISAEQLTSGYLFLNGPVDPINTPELTYEMANYTAYFDDYSLVSVPLSPVNAIIEFASTNILADEFMSTARINVARRGFTSAAVRVTVSTTNGTALAGEDYEVIFTFVTFAAGETNKVVEVPLHDDYFAEPDKFFTARITDLPPGATSGQPTTRVLIRDDDRPGSIDHSWSTRFGLPPLAPGEVKYAYPAIYPIPAQADGKLIVSVEIYSPSGAGNSWRIVRLNTNGTVDTTFQMYQSSNPLYATMLDAGKVLIHEASFPLQRVHRRHANGAPDSSLSLVLSNRGASFVRGFPDGKILVYGENISVNGNPPRHLWRLNSDGSPDATFTPPPLGARFIPPLLLPDGRILVPPQSGPVSDPTLRLLNTNGTLDTNFNIGTGPGGGTFPTIAAALLQEDGKIVLSGSFRTFNGQLRNSIVRLHSNGSIDQTFSTGQGFTLRDFTGSRIAGYVSIDALPNGNILASWNFDQFDGKPVNGPIVLRPDGSRDPSFEGPIVEKSEYIGDSFVYGLGLLNGQPLYFRDYGMGRLRMNLPLRIVSHERDPNGTTRLTANALTGRNYTLQASVTLNDWTDLTTQSATTNRIEFTDTPTNSPAIRLYRVRQN